MGSSEREPKVEDPAGHLSDLEMSVLQTISRSFLSSWSTEETCEAVAANIAHSLRTTFAVVLRHDTRAQVLRRAGYFSAVDVGPFPLDFSPTEMLAGNVLTYGEPIAVLDVQERSVARDTVAGSLGIRTYVAVPLRARVGIIGILMVASLERRPDLVTSVRLLESVGTHLAQEVSRRQAEEALAESELRLRTLFDSSRDAIGVSLRGVHVLVNDAYVKLFGFESAQQLVGTSILDLIADSDRPAVVSRIQARFAGEPVPSSYTLRALRRSGEEFDMEVHASGYDLHGQRHTIVILRDITEQLAAERALVESELRHRELFEHVPVGLWEEDLSGAKRLLDGLGPEAHADLRTYLRMHPEVTAQCAASVRVQHVNAAVCSMLGAKDERELLGNLDKIFAPESIPPFGDALAMLHSGTAGFRVEGVNRSLSGELRWIDLRGSFARGHEHDWSKMLLSTTDITELKRAEAERSSLEEQLQHARRMEAIGTLAGGVAHDFNNILAAIVGFGELSLLQAKSNDPVRDDIAQILKAAYRARDLVQQILAFSRRAVQERKPVDLASVIQDALKLIRATTPANIELRFAPAPEGCTVLADVTQVHQVLMNLCANARWAVRSKPSGLIQIELERAELVRPLSARDTTLAAGPYVRLSVTDDGCGMDEATRARVFDPYFTSKPVGEGSGLGLSVVHGIVASHGGAITVSSERGRGTRFELLLPAVDQRRSSSVPPPEPPAAASGEHVLLVDDEPDVANVCSRMLERAGYRVTATSDPMEALRLFQGNPGDYAIVVTDQSLPHMTGSALTKQILAVRADARVIICTGYSESLDDKTAREIGARRLLMKPLDMTTLTRAVRQVLDDDA